MRKIRVLFPYVEAGMGHIMPMKSIEETFRKKYGDRVEVISSNFFTDSGNRNMIEYEKMLARQVKLYNKLPFIGFTGTAACEFFGTTLSSFFSIRGLTPFAFKNSVEYMEKLKPDVVVSTHWVTNYYANSLKNRPLTVMYCPDAKLNKLFEYKSDLTLISTPSGYADAIKKRKYSEENIKEVPFLIRNEAFKIGLDKREIRRKLGLPEDNFTVLIAEGGYGIGKIENLTKRLAEKNIPLTVIPVCGTNEKLYRRMCELKSSSAVTLKPYGFADNILELHAASDIFCGKSGNILAESTFFGNPAVITHFANSIEQSIAKHYINTVGCAIKEFSPKKAAQLICDFAQDKKDITPYSKAALRFHEHFGSSAAADAVFERIKETFKEVS
ncbi:MAG: hypothetical protein J5852_04535 [Clostridia bacterium]|nr:hypothetical protein [Clostridia bacterium]